MARDQIQIGNIGVVLGNVKTAVKYKKNQISSGG